MEWWRDSGWRKLDYLREDRGQLDNESLWVTESIDGEWDTRESVNEISAIVAAEIWRTPSPQVPWSSSQDADTRIS